MVYKREFNTVPGATDIVSFSLYGVTILGVEREGLGHTQVSLLFVPSGRQFSYYTFGRVRFDPTNPFNSGEKVWVMYKN